MNLVVNSCRQIIFNKIIYDKFLINCCYFHTSHYRHGHWFSNRPKIVTVNPPPKFNNDWEHGENEVLPGDELIPALKDSPLLDKVTDKIALKLSSLEFSESQDEYLEVFMNKMFDRLGFHITDDSIAAEVVRLTVRIRYLKQYVKDIAKNKRAAYICMALIKERKRLVRQLRQENKEKFEWLSKELGIALSHHDPFDFSEDNILSEDYFKRAKVKQECYEQRQAKKEEFHKILKEQKKSFMLEKEKELTKLRQDLASVDGCRTLPELLAEVVKERQQEVMKPIHDDKLKWWYKEAALRADYQRVQADKAEAARRLQRK